MKKVLKIFCFILALYAICFPFCYFGKNIDKKEVRVSHILVDTEEEANKIKSEIEEGKKFEDLVEKIPMCEQYDCGDLGYTQRRRLVPEIDSAVFTMPQDKISDPIKTDYGWHIVKVTKINYYSDSENFKYNPYRYYENI